MLDTYLTNPLQSLAFVRQAKVIEMDQDGRVRVAFVSTEDNLSINQQVWAILTIEIESRFSVKDNRMILPLNSVSRTFSLTNVVVILKTQSGCPFEYLD